MIQCQRGSDRDTGKQADKPRDKGKARVIEEERQRNRNRDTPDYLCVL